MPPRYFTSYSGVKLPFNLIGEIPDSEIANRNTFIRAEFNADDRLVFLEHMVYGEPQLSHTYVYRADGGLETATINNLVEEEITVMTFDEKGVPIGA